MRLYQLKTFLVLFLFSVSVFGKADCRSNPRTLSCLYAQVNTLDEDKVENESLVLKNYHLVISTATWCASCQTSQPLWESLAQKLSKDLNVVVVYDNYHQNLNQIKADSAATLSYDFFDKNRQFYYWFHDIQPVSASPKDAVAKAVLVGPGDKILYTGPITSEDQIKEIQSKIKINK